MSSRSWILCAASLLGACGRMGFDPHEDESALPPGKGGSASGETCATAQVIEPKDDVIVKSTVGAQKDIQGIAGCGEGPEMVLRFSGIASGFPMRIEANFSGTYAVGHGCPLSNSHPLVCGTFSENQTSTLSLDVTGDTYVILRNAPGAAGIVELALGQAAL